jgi:hypothetical protein
MTMCAASGRVSGEPGARRSGQEIAEAEAKEKTEVQTARNMNSQAALFAWMSAKHSDELPALHERLSSQGR